MSIIKLRTRMARRRRRGAVVVALLLLTSGVAVHHAAATGSHGTHDAPALVAHGDHAPGAPPVPATDVAEVVAVCLAVLPFVAALFFIGVALTRRLWSVGRLRVPLTTAVAEVVAPRARAGPYELCVMRC